MAGIYILCLPLAGIADASRARVCSHHLSSCFPMRLHGEIQIFLEVEERYTCHGIFRRNIKREKGSALYSNYSRSTLLRRGFSNIREFAPVAAHDESNN